MLRIYERRPRRDAPVRKDARSRDLDDTVLAGPDAGGFQVDAHERSRKDEMGGELLGQVFYVHGFVVDDVDKNSGGRVHTFYKLAA